MEDKDRIIKTTEENCHNTLEERLAEQDRISFKVGKQRGRQEAWQDIPRRLLLKVKLELSGETLNKVVNAFERVINEQAQCKGE